MENQNKQPINFSLPIVVTDPVYLFSAKKLADHLNSPVITDPSEAMQSGIFLKWDEKGLSLTDGTISMYGDFTDMLPRLKPGRLQGEFLIKAVKIKNHPEPLQIVDATAGMGEDSLLLAAFGHHVDLYEYNPVIAALLQDTLNRSAEHPDLSAIVLRMNLHEEDSIQALHSLHQSPDVIVLDPMFPKRQKSALIKKKFQLLHNLESPCENEEKLLNSAIAADPKKIVIKRPLKGPFLAGQKPSYSITGKAIRYDCLILHS